MDARQRLINCLDNVLGKSNTSETYPFPAVERLDEETYTIALVCFSLASLSILLHLLLVLCLHSVRQLYGPWITLALLWYFISQCTTLLSCTLSYNSPEHRVVSSLADFAVLATLSTTLMSTIGLCRQLWLGVMLTPSGTVQLAPDMLRLKLPCITVNWRGAYVHTLVSICFILAYPTTVLVGSNCYPGSERNQTGSGEVSIVEDHSFSCNIIPNRARFHLIFPAIFILIAAQQICDVICARLRHRRLAGCSMLEQVAFLKSRFWINAKFSVTNGCIWPTAFLAVYWPSLTVWHVFTLLCSLQAIYLTVSCIFSRPLLDCLHQWHEGRVGLETKHVASTGRR